MQILHDAGARDVLIVGGFVRDSLIGLESKDVDIEVYGLDMGVIHRVLRYDAGMDVNEVGVSFGVLKVDNEIDVSVPRRENKIGVGHRGFDVDHDPNMSIKEAASRRDFTINSMAMRMDGTILDPHGGRVDLDVRCLRHTSQAFVEDPLRVMRAMQFASRFRMWIHPDTEELCREMAPQKQELPKERIWEEWKKWALKGVKPSLGLLLLKNTLWLDPEIAALVDCPQDPEWHPEGWSAFPLSDGEISAINSRFTSAAEAIGADSRSGLRQFIKLALAQAAIPIHRSAAFSTQTTEVDVPSDSLFATPLAGTPGFRLTSGSSEAISAHTMRFMREKTAVATGASKVVRIMLEVPQSSMLCVMRSAVNDFEILNAIVEPVSIFMMNMLFGSQWSSQFQFHQDAVKSNLPLFTGPTNVSVATIVTDAARAPIDGNVIVSFDLCFESDVSFTHDDFLVVDKSFSSLFYTKITQGDVFVHTCHVVDAAAKIAEREQLADHDRLVLMFAALTHDFGKPTTTEFIDGRLRSRGHCQAGVKHAEWFLSSIGAPLNIIEQVKPLVAEHLVHAGAQLTERAVKRLANRLHPTSIKMLGMLVESDHSGRLPLPPGNPLAPWVEMANDLDLSCSRPEPILMGRHLIEMGVTPGPKMGRLLSSAFDAQMDGRFSDLDEARRWARSRVGS
jgi:tRNA nucleotidyltransferase/poly(A) polymerase